MFTKQTANVFHDDCIWTSPTAQNDRLDYPRIVLSLPFQIRWNLTQRWVGVVVVKKSREGAG
jgi:hypothetical protein